jgi:hypothetical protein
VCPRESNCFPAMSSLLIKIWEHLGEQICHYNRKFNNYRSLSKIHAEADNVVLFDLPFLMKPINDVLFDLPFLMH